MLIKKSLKVIILSVLIGVLLINMNLVAQKSLQLGLGVGASRGINDSKSSERGLGMLYGGSILYKNGLGNDLTLELNVNAFSNKSTNTDEFNQYETNYLIPELKLRYVFGMRKTRGGALDPNYVPPNVFPGIQGRGRKSKKSRRSRRARMMV
jgi:hypothetical protein